MKGGCLGPQGIPGSQSIRPLPPTAAHSGPPRAAETHFWQLVSARSAAAPLPARSPLPLGALQQRALGQAAPVAGRRHRRPVARIGHAASLCAAAAARGPRGAGAQPAAAGHEPSRRDLPREPRGEGRGRAAGLGVGDEEEARAQERGLEPRPGQRGGGAWPGGVGRVARKQGLRTRVLAGGRGVAMAAGGGAGRCQGCGRRGRGVGGTWM